MSTPKKQKTLVTRMIEEILIRKGQPLPDPPKPTPKKSGTAEVAALDAYLADVEAAHAHDAAQARRDYVEALRRLAPARTEPAPAPGAHALAAPPTAPPPAKEELAAILKAVGKTPDDLRADLDAFVIVRARADLVAKEPALTAESRKLGAQIEALKVEWEKVQTDFAKRAGNLDLDQRVVDAERDKATEATFQLRWDQYLEEEIAHTRLHRPYAACLIPGSEKCKARDAWLAAFQEVQDTLHAGAPRLEYLERTFFPPPPLPDEPTVQEPAEWSYTPRQNP